MNVWNEQETAPLISRSGMHAIISDTRKDYEKKRALHFILTCIFFERIAFYALMNILFTTLQWNEPFNWDIHHSQSVVFIFSGK
jgi:hypothetical protein